MTSTTVQANLEAIQSWATGHAYPVTTTDESLEVEIPLNNTKITGSFLLLESGLVLLIPIDLGAEQPKFEDVGVVALAINSKIPFGTFDIQFPDARMAFYRISTILDSPPSTAVLNVLVRWAGHGIGKYASILTVVAQGLVDAQTAIQRLNDDNIGS